MFTGLIQKVGKISAIGSLPGGRIFRIHHELPEKPEIGGSVAVNGVCLTVTVSRTGGMNEICVEGYFETLRKTTLQWLRQGDQVNLEPALRADGRLDGHLVQGHVSSAGRISKMTRIGKGMEMAVCLPPGPEKDELIPEGSVALDGVSLTIAHLDNRCFYVQLIGETLENTILGGKKTGDLVNLETDFLLRSRRPQKNAGVQIENLIQWGYV